MIQVIMDDKKGQLWDISKLVTEMSWKTSRKGKAGSLDLTFVKGTVYQNRDFTFANGNIIAVKIDGRPVFYGYIFSIDFSEKEEVKITAFDGIRYLMLKDLYNAENVTATEVIQQICKKYNIRAGVIADTVHRIPGVMEDNKQLIDIIMKVLDDTLMATGELYVLYDDFGSLTLRSPKDMIVMQSVGEGSQLTSFSYKISIDSDTYNFIKFSQENKTTGKRDVYVVKDSATMAKWGWLQYYRVVDEKMNKAQISELIDKVMQMKNRETRTLSLDALGDLAVRAGCFVHVRIDELAMNQLFIVNECTHDFGGDAHTMKLQLEVINRVDSGSDSTN